MTSPPTNTSPPSPRSLNTPRRWWRRPRTWLIAAVLLLVLHQPILRGLGRALVVRESWPAADYVLVASGDGRFERAVQMLADGRARQVLLVEGGPSRTMRLGVVPPPNIVGRQELHHLGVTDTAIVAETADYRGERELAEWLSGWLTTHGNPSITLLCNLNESASMRRLFDTLLPASQAAQIKVLGLDSRAYDAERWWLSINGIRNTAICCSRLAQDLIVGYDTQEPYEWDFDAYAESLR